MESRHREQASYLRSQRGSVFTMWAGGNIKELLKRKKNSYFWGFPDGLVVRNPPANTRDMGSIPGQGRLHMLCSNEARGLPSIESARWSLGPAATEPQPLEPVLCNEGKPLQ